MTTTVDLKIQNRKSIITENMKLFIASCSFAALICILIASIEAASTQEPCPSGMTPEQCKAYAEKKHKDMNVCIRHEFLDSSIEWANCGRILCGENTREIEADLSKPYPECCQRCDIIDPTKPGSSYAIGK